MTSARNPVTIKISWMPLLTSPCTMCSRMGVPLTLSIGLGSSLVSSRMRVPLPAAKITAFTPPSVAAGVARSIHGDRQAFGVAVELGRVHALDLGDAGLVTAFVLDARGIFKDVNSFRQVIDKKVAGGIAGRFVVAQAVLVFVARQDVNRFRATATLVFKVDVFHIAIHAQFDPHDQFVSYIE